MAEDSERFRVLQPEDLGNVGYRGEYVDQNGQPVPRPDYGASRTRSTAQPLASPYLTRSDVIEVHVHNHTHVVVPETDEAGSYATESPQYAVESWQPEEPRRHRGRTLGVLVTAALVVGGGYAGFKELTGAPSHNRAATVVVPETGSTEAAAPTLGDSVVDPNLAPSPTTGIDLNALTQVTTDTNKPKPTTVPTKAPSATHSVKVVPAPATESTPTRASKTKTEIKTEAPHHVSYELSPGMVNNISNVVERDRLSFLEDNNPGLKDFMDRHNLAHTANLSSVTAETINNYRTETNTLSSRYNAWEGGISKYYNPATLTDYSQVASAMVGQTDHILAYAGYTYDSDPQLRVIDLAYLPKGLRERARDTIRKALNEGDDPSQLGYTEADDAAVLGVTTQTLKDGSRVNLIATWSSYGAEQNGRAVEKVRWALPVKITSSNNYVNVTMAEIDVSSLPKQD
jgi:hypothetical protein